MTIILYLIIIVIQSSLSIFLYHNDLRGIFAYIGYSIFAVLIISYTLTIFKNPGIPGRKANYLSKDKQKSLRSSRISDGYLTCKVCNVYVTQNIKIGHCLSCKICIVGYDHHCGWSSKCIGSGNLFYFWIFFISFILFIIYNFICVLCYNISDYFRIN